MRQAERQHDAFYDALAGDPTFSDFCIYKYHPLFIDRDRALRLKLAVSELQALVHELSESNIDAREAGEFVRVQFTVMSLPAQQESKRRKPEDP
jgi:hypothetical protein